MRIHKVLESIFGSPAKIHILRVLLNSPQPLSGRQVGELSGLTHKGAIHALKSLVELGAVQQGSKVFYPCTVLHSMRLRVKRPSSCSGLQ